MEIVQKIKSGLTEERLAKYKKLAALRQDMTVILEDVHDPHNIGAVIRSCDAVGIGEIYVIQTEGPLEDYLVKSKSSRGAFKWVEIHIFDNREECIESVRKNYSKIYGTHLSENASSLYDLNLDDSVALMFGNEHAGLSEEALSYLDGNFIIPQYGMVQSLNVSVACAVSLFEASRQRDERGMYDYEFNNKSLRHQNFLNKFIMSNIH